MTDHIDTALPLDVKTLSVVFAHIETAVILASLDRKIVSINDAAKTLFGFSDKEVLNQSTRMLYANEHDFSDLGRNRFNDTADYIDESSVATFKNKSGYIFKCQVTGGPIKNAAGKSLFYVAMIQDDSSRLNAEETLNKLHSITSNQQLSFKQRLEAILLLGCDHYGLPIGIFSKIDGNRYVIQQAVHPDNQLEEQMAFALDETYCTHVFQANKAKGFHNVATSEIESHPCYQNFKLEAYIGVPVFVDGLRYGTLNFSSNSPTKPFIRQDYELIRLFAEWVGHEIARNNDLDALKNAHDQLEILANTDALTGLANRGFLEQVLQDYLQNRFRHKHGLVVALFDFDNFKDINDKHGHDIGDEALKVFAHVANEFSRSDDVYGRWGGEEFLAIFPTKNVQGVSTSLERLQNNIRQAGLKIADKAIILTVSVGVTMLEDADDIYTLLKRVDTLLYKAKDNGRDRIEIG
ncbi:diguanylate cyclase [Vibrio sp. DW001]|uniref:sensor domain-containing diguanylate cyclase n=1 Tax=Vibrio sp. DW001 TaxID=2912315 RepID=UPI0023AF067E|nr:diguanylate cyclase [Vibrio sp. DW001]WED28539.1 diguanylate cyclase [Vibrio sp. DW001]